MSIGTKCVLVGNRSEASILDRLVDWHVYRDHSPQAKPLYERKERMIRPPFANLLQN